MDAVTGMDGAGGKKKAKVKPGSFQGLGLSQAAYKAVMKMGYNMPTPIQRKTIPTCLDGQDVVAMARTGSGKTAAFLIPIVERLKSHSVSVGFRAVTLAPTRELAMQTAKFFRQLARFSDLRCCLLVGGQAMEAQFDHLANNPDVIIATPGRLMHHILEADLSLSRVEMLVFDEADRLFELGFAEQLHKIVEATPMSRQCLLFSATLPAQLVSFSRVGLKDPVFVRLDVETTLSDSLDLWYLYVRKDEKIAAAVSVLRHLAKPGKSTIMFVATKHHVEFFGDLLTKVGLSCAVVYGSMDQDAREENIARFRRKKASILVTTDVAARGIDVPLLDHVLNFDFPPSGKLFVHRAGRTARAGRSGLAISLVALDDLPYTVELQLFLGRKLAVADGSAPADGKTPLLGALPPLEHEIETLTALLEDEGSELQSFHKSMMASYGLYNKTRPPASKQSVSRAKQLLEDCGGPARLQTLVHPAFQDGDGSQSRKAGRVTVASAAQEAAFIQELRGFRPKAEKVGNVLSMSAMRTMELAKLDATAVAATRSKDESGELLAAGGDNSSSKLATAADTATAADACSGGDDGGGGAAAAVDADDDRGGGKKKRSKGAKRKLAHLMAEPEPAAKAAPKQQPAAAAPRDRPRLSKRARLKLGRAGDGAASAGAAADDFGDEFDIAVDGVKLAGSSAAATATSPTEGGQAAKRGGVVGHFYLSTERDQTEEAKERGLDMEQYQMDLMPDDASDIKKAKSVIRWDAKKKKYLPVMVSVDGRAVKSMRRDEAGGRVKGEAGKSNIYKKWAQSTKRRIQKVGELEQTYLHPLGRGRYGKGPPPGSADNTVEFDDKGESKKTGEAANAKQRKPVVPFHGEIEAKYLTNKQKRMLKRREKKDSVIGGHSAKKEIKSVSEMQKAKQLKERNKLKQTPHLRKQKAKMAKDARMKLQEERQMKYGARTRSRMLIFEGPPKVKKKGGGRRGLPTI